MSYSLNWSVISQRVLFKRESHVAQTTNTRLTLLPSASSTSSSLQASSSPTASQASLGKRPRILEVATSALFDLHYGIALAAFLVCGRRIWPAIALGAFLIAFFSPVTHLAALGQAVGATLSWNITLISYEFGPEHVQVVRGRTIKASLMLK